MDAIFNIKRFGSLISREFTYSWKIFLYIILGLASYFIVAKLMDAMWQVQLLAPLPMFCIILIIGGAPWVNKNLNHTNFVSFLATPASGFEKWLLLWVKTVLVLPIIVVGTVYLMNLISPSDFIDSFFSIECFSKDIFVERIYLLFAFQSIFFFGYIYFRNRSSIKTVIAILITMILVYVISMIVFGQFYPEVSKVVIGLDIARILNFGGFYNSETKAYISPETTAIYDACQWIIKLIFPLGLWALSYIKLRETEL